ncbi:MAG: hypothetical protein L6Q37_12065 [Bdellovibrionaceae bacterium]|nr:hypothetical protein [Pseudobdellovibrionaceae bacterium]
MEVKKVGQLDTLMPSNSLNSSVKNGVNGLGPNFRDTLDKAKLEANLTAKQVSSFGLKQEIPKLSDSESGVKFSNHAIERMRTRGISFKAEDISRLNEAVDRAANKGSKDSLILMNDSALIVSVKNKTVVTVMDKAALKENVFTNIDSTIVM